MANEGDAAPVRSQQSLSNGSELVGTIAHFMITPYQARMNFFLMKLGGPIFRPRLNGASVADPAKEGETRSDVVEQSLSHVVVEMVLLSLGLRVLVHAALGNTT